MTGTLVAVAAGGALGAVARLALQRWAIRSAATAPARALWDAPARATLAANLIGCLALGLFLGAGPERPVWLDALVVTGLCGGLSTFSTLISDLTRLADRGRRLEAFGYLAASFALGALALWMGTQLGRMIGL